MDSFNKNQLKVQLPPPRYLWFLTLSFTMVILLANWFDARFVCLWGITTDAGTIIFPLTFLLSDLITEVYGYQHTRRAIWCGFLFNAVYIVYSQIVIHLPSPSFPTHNEAFDQLMAMNTRIVIASAISYFSSEPLNSFIMAKLKIKMQGHHMGIRFVSSTVVSSFVDSFIFSFIAFYGIMSNRHLMALIFTMWFIKVTIEIIGLPISIHLAKKLKTAEQLDIYDKRTNFTLFQLSVGYVTKDNNYSKKD